MPSGSSTDATGATVRPSAPDRWHGLAVRALAGAVLAPPVLVALYVGPPFSDVLVLAAAGLGAWEWARLCGHGQIDLTGTLLVGGVLAAVLAGALGTYNVAAWLLALATLATAIAGARRRDEAQGSWPALGALYLGAAALAFLWLRDRPGGGAIVVWMIAAVWATDIGSYFAGRAIGGRKLAPSISPGKTWAGLFGGIVAAACLGAILAAILFPQPLIAQAALLGAVIAVIAQLGDLFESRLKRRFGAKDAGQLIPGHGGVLDRIDGVLAVSLVLGGLDWLTRAGL